MTEYHVVVQHSFTGGMSGEIINADTAIAAFDAFNLEHGLNPSDIAGFKVEPLTTHPANWPVLYINPETKLPDAKWGDPMPTDGRDHPGFHM